MVWTKGKICGIDNCRSQFYEILNGRRVCQYNHVQDGLETTGDDDDYTAVGQRIRRPRAPTNAGGVDPRAHVATTLRGVEARQLLCRCLQTVFRHQLQFVVARFSLDSEFERCARELWACFLLVYKQRRFGLLHLVALAYLSTRRSNNMVLLSDFHRYILAGEFPYFECYRLLPLSDYQQLPSDLRKHFMPSVARTHLRLYEQTCETKQRLEKRFGHLRFVSIPEPYVCFRFVSDFCLPPPVYAGALRILERLPTAVRRAPRSGMMSEEIPGLCAVVVAAKLYWGLGSTGAGPMSVDLGLWEDVLRKLWLLTPNHAQTDERLVHNWSGNQIDDYLAWYSQTLTVPSLDKHIRAMFPVPDVKADSGPKLPSPEVLSELCELLYTVPAAHSEAAGEPGAEYRVFSTRSEDMSPAVKILYAVVERVLNTDAELVRKLIRGFELRVRSAFADSRW